MMLDEISNLKNVLTSSSNITSMTISDSLPDPVSTSLVSPFPSAANAVNRSHSNLGFDSQSRSNSVKRNDTMLFASDSLLNRMSIKKINVGNLISANTATLKQTLCCLQEQTTSVDVKQHHVKLLDELIDSINELKKFENIKTLFLCRLPPRSDHAVINRKVSEYNDLMSQHFAEYEFVIVIDTVPLERDLFYKDGLHLSRILV